MDLDVVRSKYGRVSASTRDAMPGESPQNSDTAISKVKKRSNELAKRCEKAFERD